MNPPPSPFRCPTCRAVQAPSDCCRRCRSDLRLLVAVWRRYEACRTRCLVSLREGRHEEAVEWAGECLRIHVTDDSRRLAAVSALLAGDWRAAVAQASATR